MSVPKSDLNTGRRPAMIHGGSLQLKYHLARRRGIPSRGGTSRRFPSLPTVRWPKTPRRRTIRRQKNDARGVNFLMATPIIPERRKPDAENRFPQESRTGWFGSAETGLFDFASLKTGMEIASCHPEHPRTVKGNNERRRRRCQWEKVAGTAWRNWNRP